MEEKGRLLPHFMELPKLIIDNKYVELDLSEFEKSGQITDKPVRDYDGESYLHYHQFVDACLGKDKCSAPFFLLGKTHRDYFTWSYCRKFSRRKITLG